MGETNNVEELQPLETNQLKYDQNGLLPAVIQDVRTDAVLMVGYMNEEAVKKNS